jgi:hypothetical protein
MNSFLQGMKQLLATLPVIIMITLIEVIISFCVGALLMLEMMPGLGRQSPYTVLGLAILGSIITQIWIVYNHKVRAYVKQGVRNE